MLRLGEEPKNKAGCSKLAFTDTIETSVTPRMRDSQYEQKLAYLICQYQ